MEIQELGTPSSHDPAKTFDPFQPLVVPGSWVPVWGAMQKQRDHM